MTVNLSKKHWKQTNKQTKTTWPAVHSLESATELKRAHLHEMPAYKPSVCTPVRPDSGVISWELILMRDGERNN